MGKNILESKAKRKIPAKKTKLPKRKRDWSEEQLEQAKGLYMSSVPLSEIAREMGIPRSSLQHYEKTYWKAEKDAWQKEILQAAGSLTKEAIFRASKAGTTVMVRALEHMAKRAEPPTVKEAEIASKIMQNLDAIAAVTADDKEQEEEVEMIEVEALDPFNLIKKGDK